MTGNVTILTGPPGAGKTTVAALLATGAERPTVHVVTDAFYRWIRTGFVAPFLPEAHRQNEVVVESIAQAVVTFARGGYDVVVDGIVGPWFLAPFRSLADDAGIGLSYVVLRPDLSTALARATARPGGELTDVGAITGLHRAFEELGEYERHAFDSAGLDADQTAERVRELLASGLCRLPAQPASEGAPPG